MIFSNSVEEYPTESVGSSVMIQDGILAQVEDKSKLILLVSGLELGGVHGLEGNNSESSIPVPISVQMLLDFASGRIGGAIDSEVARRIVR